MCYINPRFTLLHLLYYTHTGRKAKYIHSAEILTLQYCEAVDEVE